jgi:hypothetical protein
MQSLLLQDVSPAPPTRYYLVQNAYDRTPARAVLVPRADGEWVTAFPGDRQVAKRAMLRDLAEGPGDGHATVASQLALSPQEQAAMAVEPYYVTEGHFRVILDPTAQQRIVEYLGDVTPGSLAVRGGRLAPGAQAAQAQREQPEQDLVRERDQVGDGEVDREDDEGQREQAREAQPPGPLEERRDDEATGCGHPRDGTLKP